MTPPRNHNQSITLLLGTSTGGFGCWKISVGLTLPAWTDPSHAEVLSQPGRAAPSSQHHRVLPQAAQQAASRGQKAA